MHSSVGFQNTLWVFFLLLLLLPLSLLCWFPLMYPTSEHYQIQGSGLSSLLFSIFPHSLNDLTKSLGSKYLLSANDSQILISRLHHSPEFQTQMFNCLLSLPFWYLRISMFKRPKPNFTLIIMQCLSLSLITCFVLRFISLEISYDCYLHNLLNLWI